MFKIQIKDGKFFRLLCGSLMYLNLLIKKLLQPNWALIVFMLFWLYDLVP